MKGGKDQFLSFEAVSKEVQDKLGTIDVLVNNAGNSSSRRRALFVT
jgi:short-subunit dehydrogenase